MSALVVLPVEEQGEHDQDGGEQRYIYNPYYHSNPGETPIEPGLLALGRRNICSIPAGGRTRWRRRLTLSWSRPIGVWWLSRSRRSRWRRGEDEIRRHDAGIQALPLRTAPARGEHPSLVGRSVLRITENAISASDLLEPSAQHRRTVMSVGVVLLGELQIGMLDLGAVRAFVHAQNRIIIGLLSHRYRPLDRITSTPLTVAHDAIPRNDEDIAYAAQ